MRKLHNEDNKKEFQNKGISDPNFIGMVKECNNDIKKFNQISFLPTFNTLIHRKNKSLKLAPFEGKCLGCVINTILAPSVQTESSRRTTAFSTRSLSTQHIDSLIRKYWSSSHGTRRNIDMNSLEDRKRLKSEIHVSFITFPSEISLILLLHTVVLILILEKNSAVTADNPETECPRIVILKVFNNLNS